jgi:hypothetical protein
MDTSSSFLKITQAAFGKSAEITVDSVFTGAVLKDSFLYEVFLSKI